MPPTHPLALLVTAAVAAAALTACPPPAPASAGDPGPVLDVRLGPDSPPLPAGALPPPPGPVPAAARYAPPPPTRARRGTPMARGISDGRPLLHRAGTPLAEAVLRRARATGATVVRLPVRWRVVAPRRPADETDPADPALGLAEVDGAVRAAAGRGLEPLLVVFGAPDWAEGPRRWRFAPAGTWAPDPAAFGRFAGALARRYDGTHPDPLRPGHALPRVRRWQAWNEPNLGRYLQPQWVAREGRWAPWSPGRYRALLNAFAAGVRAAAPGNRVLTAGTAPSGESRDGEGRMPPVRFWRAVLAGPAAFDVLAHHPLSVGEPTRAARGPLDVAIADLDRLGRLLDAAGRPRRLAITELNWDEPHPAATPAQVAGHVARGLELLWRGGAELVVWQFLRDPPGTPTGREHPAGLWRIDTAAPWDPARDRPKPALRAWSTPFTAALPRRARSLVWGLAPGRHAVVQVRRGGRWRRLAAVPVRAGAVHARVPARPGAELRLVTSRGTSRAVRAGAPGQADAVAAPSSSEIATSME